MAKIDLIPATVLRRRPPILPRPASRYAFPRVVREDGPNPHIDEGTQGMSGNRRAAAVLSTLVLVLVGCSSQSGSGVALPQVRGSGPSALQSRVRQNPDAGAVEFGYVPNVGSSNISAYSIDAKTGALKQIAGSPFVTGSGTSAIAIDPSGKFAYDTDSGSTTVSAFTVNAASGALEAVEGVAVRCRLQSDCRCDGS